MAIDSATLSTLIKNNLTAQGFDLTNEFCFASKLADSVAAAVVTHLQTDSILVATTIDEHGAIVTGKVG